MKIMEINVEVKVMQLPLLNLYIKIYYMHKKKSGL